MKRGNLRESRLAIPVIIVGLLMSCTGIAYIAYTYLPQSLPAAPLQREPVEPSTEYELSQTARILAGVMLTGLILLVFIVGAYLMIKIGRMVLGTSTRDPRTTYHDAWSNYRLTDDQINAVLEDYGAAGPPRDGSEESDDDDRPPADNAG